MQAHIRSKAINKSLFYFLCCLICHSTTVYARWATLEDADVLIEQVKTSIQVQASGNYTEVTEIQAKVLKESGKDQLISIPLPYNASNTVFKILDAKTIVDGKAYPVDPKHIEDKPLASNIQGFDQQNQILIAFPKIALNASIYIKYQADVKEPPLSGFFSKHWNVGFNGYTQYQELEILSELPLHITQHDPEHIFNSAEARKEKQFYFKASLKKPVFFSVIDESNAILNETTLPWIRICTLKKWSEFGTAMTPPFEAVIQEPIPAYFDSILQKARAQNNVTDQINSVTAGLAEALTYMGDWRTIHGAYAPRALKEIAETRFGDCKDFSTLTAALLRQLGLDASVALVHRAVPAPTNVFALPGFDNFNHAIVYVSGASSGPNARAGSKKTQSYWIDPTNFTSFAPNIYPDIAGRPALVLFNRTPKLEQIPNLSAQDGQNHITEQITLKTEGQLQAKGQLKLEGWRALALSGASLKNATESIDLDIIRYVADQNRLVSWKVGAYELKSRIVKPLDFSFEYALQNASIKSTAGNAYLLDECGATPVLLLKTKDRVSDLYLGLPFVARYDLLLSKTQAVGNQFSNCSVNSPWFKGQRRIQNTPEGIQVSDTQILLQSVMPQKFLNTAAHQKLQSDIYACLGTLALIYHNQDTPQHTHQNPKQDTGTMQHMAPPKAQQLHAP